MTPARATVTGAGALARDNKDLQPLILRSWSDWSWSDWQGRHHILSYPPILYTGRGEQENYLLGVPVRLFTTVAGLQCYLDLCRGKQPRTVDSADLPPANPQTQVGFVPTMGALHAGHRSLIERARRENKIVVVSIFVNPLQFGLNEDFGRYPRTLERDRALCAEAGVDALFAPSAAEIGVDPPTPTRVLPPAAMTARLCGATRTGHFEGVTTIVTKLLGIVQPDRAYFGQKDAQQLAILRQMVADLDLNVTVVPCPIVRETNGLALSSRNQYLSGEEREQAAVLYRSLSAAEKLFRSGERMGATLIQAIKLELEKVPVIQPEYIELVNPTTLEPIETVTDEGLLALAVRLRTTRLIDNCVLRDRKAIIAIDGPAGAGKSTVAKKVAQVLDLFYLDSGAMYRALTWFVLQSGIDLSDEPAVAELTSQCDIEFQGFDSLTARVLVNGEDVTQAIRMPQVTAQVSAIAAQGGVRKVLVQHQQNYGRRGGIVVDGRDIGTHVFPDAELKVYLTASIEERARRRHLDLKQLGQPEIPLSELEHTIAERDRKDSTREISPLRKAEDAIEINSDPFTVDQVVEQIVRLYHQVTA